MSRIVYVLLTGQRLSGGQKMIVRHVETLRELGFDAVCWTRERGPAGLDHKAPLEIGTSVRPDDVIVVPEDGPAVLKSVLELGNRFVVFCQNQFYFASTMAPVLEELALERPITFMTPGRVAAEMVGRISPQSEIHIVPSFADERIFHPRGEKRRAVALSPRKRQLEARVIQTLFRKAHPRHAHIPWIALDGASEQEVADTFASAALFLCLSRFEAAPITPLEAMASGCVCAGFQGIGGREHSTPANGFWVPDDDCEAAADALARAADLVVAGGPPLQRYRQAGAETAAHWSYAAFRPKLEETWMRLAPQARCSNGPLD